MTKKRVFSGVQPTGNLHLGNYLGAVRNWVAMQAEYECIFCIVDLHAITVPQDPAALRQATRETAAAYIACGVDPKRHIIFNQSTVSAHTELAWVLGCHTPLGWLNRMTQFKEKAGKDRENASLGLYGYPVLMAADILAYKATHVPTGEDQKQHIELARDIAGAFNRAYGKEYFPQPEPMIMGEATRVMSLRDGTKKMSKSDQSDYSRINLTDDADTIRLKFQKAKTDAIAEITYDRETRPEVANLITIYATLTGKGRDEVCGEFAGQGFAVFKKALAEIAADKLGAISAEMRRLLSDTAYLDAVLADGAEAAGNIAARHLAEVKDMVGFLSPKRA